MADNEEIKKDTAAEVQNENETETVTEEASSEESAPEAAEDAAEKPAKEKKAKNGGSKNPFRNKKFRHGSLSIVFTVIFIAAVVLVNVVVNLVLDRFNIEADLTTGSIYTLSEETEEYVRSVDDDVTFYVTAEKDSLNSAGDLYKQTVEFLDRMTSLNRRFKVQYVNLLADPDFSNKFVEELRNYQVIVESP